MHLGEMSDSDLLKLVGPEARVLLAACGEDPGLVRAAMGSAIDWELLLHLAEQERAVSVLWMQLSKAGVSIPAAFAARLRRRTMLSHFTALRMQEKAEELLGVLSARGIDVVLLKGAALAYLVYRGFRDRPMGDLDVLVDQERAEEAWRLAQELEWRWDEALYPSERYRHHHHLPPLVDERSGQFRLELHSAGNAEGHPFALTFAQVVAHARPVVLPTGRAFVMEPEFQVVHLCVHCAWAHQLHFGAWRTFRDLHALVAGTPVDWNRVVTIAQAHQAASSCYWVLRLGAALTGLRVPAETIGRFSESVPRLWRGAVARHLAVQVFQTGDVCPSHAVRRAMWSRAMNPIGQGVRQVRPWDGDPVVARGAAESRSAASRAARHLSRFRAWWRYLRVLAMPT